MLLQLVWWLYIDWESGSQTTVSSFMQAPVLVGPVHFLAAWRQRHVNHALVSLRFVYLLTLIGFDNRCLGFFVL